ncbi:hypothetical protein QO058_07870 [Bosea vestrisii]|uniref:hypothetical protein n=1 Tax=Bosea vestrisii TaxID=151416 RepID=UPI0024DFD0C6|nr:hypothetical protein [Bosea vestrisii]WID98148.1 hypothetical protein QO058_07870 [Bosea vestrisii]
MEKPHITLRIDPGSLNAVDRMVFTRRIQNAPGRAATRAAVINDLIKRGLAQTSTASEQKKDQN